MRPLTLACLIALFGSICSAADNTTIADPTTAPASYGRMDRQLPTLFLIGDSTVRNGQDTGTGKMWGWGRPIAGFFDTTKINVQNRALGGTSSRTFLTSGLWDKVLPDVKPGDFVIMQFGHNDGGALDKGARPGSPPRATLKGNGEETKDVTLEGSGKQETVHTHGWYMRRYISDTKAKGATPIVCSLIPRNSFKDGKAGRATESYGKWAAEAARQGGADFIDLNALIADRYDQAGPDEVLAKYFPDVKEHTHTTAAGAALNAECVVSGLKALRDCGLCKFFSAPADKVAVAPSERVQVNPK